MRKKSYWGLLILCGIFFQGIGTLSEQNFRESSNFHVRKKRIIDKSEFGDMPVSITHVPYIVKILKDGITECAGSILTPYMIITAAHCVEDPERYTILSDSSYVNLGTPHNITRKIIYPDYHPERFGNDLALLLINPPINLVNSLNRRILLHDGDIPENSFGTISGWGCNEITPNEKRYPTRLRSITVPLMREDECRRFYQRLLQITDKNICTLDRNGEKKCSTGDSGNPLVVGGRLVGVHSGCGDLEMSPDVFMKLSHPEYRSWIFSHLQENSPHPHYPSNQSHSSHLFNTHNRRTPLYNPYTTHSHHIGFL